MILRGKRTFRFHLIIYCLELQTTRTTTIKSTIAKMKNHRHPSAHEEKNDTATKTKTKKLNFRTNVYWMQAQASFYIQESLYAGKFIRVFS